MSMVAFAENELRRAGLLDECSDYNGMIGKAVLDIVKVFAEQGHSGGSAALASSALDRLLRQEPLTPLTGEDDEWNEVGDGVWQSRRCSHVFKDADGAYDIDGIVFRDQHGSTYTSVESRKSVTFPYMPPTFPQIVDKPINDQ